MAKVTGAKVEAGLEASIPTLGLGRHGFGGGLWLDIRGAGPSRTWYARVTIAGKPRTPGLGAWPTVSLADARAAVLALKREIHAGADPIARKRDQREAARLAAARQVTFGECARKFIASREKGWRNALHRQQWTRTLEMYVLPRIGRLPVADITVEHVLGVLRPLWSRVPETASRVRGRIEQILASAEAEGLRPGPNPARWHNHLAMILPSPQKVRKPVPHAALDWREVPEFMLELREQEGFAALALEFAILTAARSGEVRFATWSEIDWGERLWRVPGHRMKAGRDHIVPLSEPAMRLLHRLAAIRTGELIFPGASGGVLSDMAMTELLRRMGRDVTAHGMRASFKTWASDATEFPRELIEAALAHIVGDRAEQSYQRGTWLERRRALMEAWGRFVDQAATPENVVALPVRAAG